MVSTSGKWVVNLPRWFGFLGLLLSFAFLVCWVVGWGMDVCVFFLFGWMSFCVCIPFWLETGVLFGMNVFFLAFVRRF